MDLELDFNKTPICPHCKEVYDIDRNESYFLYSNDDDNHELTCPDCEKTFWCRPYVIYKFSTAIENDDL